MSQSCSSRVRHHYCTLYTATFSAFVPYLPSTCFTTVYCPISLLLPLHSFQCLIPPSIKFSSLAVSFLSSSLFFVPYPAKPSLSSYYHFISLAAQMPCASASQTLKERRKGSETGQKQLKGRPVLLPPFKCADSRCSKQITTGAFSFTSAALQWMKHFLSCLSTASHHLDNTSNYKGLQDAHLLKVIAIKCWYLLNICPFSTWINWPGLPQDSKRNIYDRNATPLPNFKVTYNLVLKNNTFFSSLAAGNSWTILVDFFKSSFLRWPASMEILASVAIEPAKFHIF